MTSDKPKAGFFDRISDFHPMKRAEWRQWLAENHLTAEGVWLVYYKATYGKPRVTYDEAVEEALCFGWVDSKPNRLDDERSKLLFTPRKPGCVWSKINKERIERLVAQGLMAPAGLAKLEAARADGTWVSLDAVEAYIMPPALEAALQTAGLEAQAYVASLSPSAQKGMFQYVATAKRAETREKRADQLARAALEQRNPLDWAAAQRAKNGGLK